jgi:hypothetical protein
MSEITGRSRLVLLTFLLVLSADTVHAQVARMQLDELSRVSTSVVQGTATRSRSVWNADRTQILTEITVAVSDQLKGSGSSETVITIPGGQIGNVRYEVSDMPSIEEGEEVLLFVWKHPSGRNLITGGVQGKLEIERVGSLAPVVFTPFDPIDKGDAQTTSRSLLDFKRQIRKLAGSQ